MGKSFRIVLCLGTLILTNCSSPMNFTQGANQLASQSGSTPTSSNNPPNASSPNSPGTPSPTPAPQPLACPAGQMSNGSACVPCQSYVQLQNNGGPITVPAEDTSATCYYLQLISAVDMSGAVNSTNWQTFRTDVWARHHSTTGEIPYVLNNMVGPDGHSNFYPRVIGSTLNANGSINTGAVASAQFTLGGQRTVTLAANSQGSSLILVDNFILLEMTSSTGQYAIAEGSADAVPWADPTNTNDSVTGPILLNGNPVTFAPFSASGTSDITPWNLSSYFPVSTTVNFKATGLDCGGIGQISDIYILFQ